MRERLRGHHGPMAPRRKKKPSPDELIAALASSSAEQRWEAARDLAVDGDRSAVAPLEHLALTDDECFQREGAFVDSTEWPHLAACDALRAIHARHAPSAEDIDRVGAHLANPAIEELRAERVAATLGTAARDAATPLLTHPEPAIRLRAVNVIGTAERAGTNRALWATDEEVRLAATRQDAYRSELVRDALERFPEEPSVIVRRGICDLWLRYRARMGGALDASDLARLLVDPDQEIQARVAAHVLEAARRRGPGWVANPGRLRPLRERLRVMLSAGYAPSPAVELRDVLELVETSLAPFDG